MNMALYKEIIAFENLRKELSAAIFDQNFKGKKSVQLSGDRIWVQANVDGCDYRLKVFRTREYQNAFNYLEQLGTTVPQKY